MANSCTGFEPQQYFVPDQISSKNSDLFYHHKWMCISKDDESMYDMRALSIIIVILGIEGNFTFAASYAAYHVWTASSSTDLESQQNSDL